MKIFKKLVSLAIALIFTAAFSVNVFADTIYVYQGYSYVLNNQNQAVIRGVTASNNSPDLVFPSSIGANELATIGLFAFSGDSNLTSVSFEEAEHLKTISAYAFENCPNLKTVKLSSTIENIGIGAFSGCTSLDDIDLSVTSLTTVNNAAFYGCTAIEEVTLPDSVKLIDSFAFANCSSLSKITLGRTVIGIGDAAFNNDNNLSIYCYYGSYAYNYARNNNIPFVFLDNYKLGDVNMNDYVDIRDVTDIQKHLAELGDPLDDLKLAAADVDGNGEVDINDATNIQLYLAEFEVEYPIGEYVNENTDPEVNS